MSSVVSQGKVWGPIPGRQAACPLRQVVEGAPDRFQSGACEVIIDLRGSRASVSEQLLDQPEVRASLEQMGGETVTERVWA